MANTNLDVPWKPVGKRATESLWYWFSWSWIEKWAATGWQQHSGCQNPGKWVQDAGVFVERETTPTIVQMLKFAAKSDIQDFQSLPSSVRHEDETDNPLDPQELQSSAGEHDGHISSTFWWFDCDIADSSLLLLGTLTKYTIYFFIQYPKFYIHTSAFTIVNRF